MSTAKPSTDTETVDVLIIGAGPSGAVVANEMARSGFSVVCLEQGRWFNNNEFPGDKQEWELLSQQKWSAEPNIRKSREDYPLAVDDSDLHPLMIGGVGGSSLLYGAQWMRRLAAELRRPGPLLRQDRSRDRCVRCRRRSDVPAGHGPTAAPTPDRQSRSPRGDRNEQIRLALVACSQRDRIPARGRTDPLRPNRHLRNRLSRGSQSVLRHHPLAFCDPARCAIEDTVQGPQGHHRHARARRRRHLLRRRRRRTPTESPRCRVGGQWNWHCAAAATVRTRRCLRRTCEFLRSSRKAPDAAPQR